MNKRIKSYEVDKVSDFGAISIHDDVVVEEVVEILVVEKNKEKLLVMTLCTPSQLLEMTLGYLFSEKLIETVDDVILEHFFDQQNRIFVKFKQAVDWQRHVRKNLQHAGCGLCSKQFLESCIEQPLMGQTLSRFRKLFTLVFIRRVNQHIQQQPSLFKQTGACHAAAVFDVSGQLLGFAEDVGRHNAVDKVVGMCLVDKLDLGENILWVSGRAGFELVIKAVRARFPVMVSVGAPSSASVELARQQGMLLLGFAKDDSFNCYT